MLFRFLSKQSSRFAYAGLIVNVGKALVRSFSGMAHDGCALSNLIQKLSETVLNVCKLVAYGRPSTKNKAQHEQPDTGALRQLGAHVWLRCCACGGSVKGGFPSRVYLPPSHKHKHKHKKQLKLWHVFQLFIPKRISTI